jgi:proteic killer suppression protein
MIGSFKDRDTKDVWVRQSKRRFGAVSRIIYRKLVQIHAAIALETLLMPPGNRLEALRGDRIGQHSIRVNDQYRICFVWREGYAYDIEVTDYH